MSLVISFTIPRLSIPEILIVELYSNNDESIHLDFKILYANFDWRPTAFEHVFLCIFIPSFIVTNPNISSPGIALQHFAKLYSSLSSSFPKTTKSKLLVISFAAWLNLLGFLPIFFLKKFIILLLLLPNFLN